MESFGLKTLVELLQAFGLPGMVFIVWYFGREQQDRMMRQYREDIQAVLRQYRDDIMTIQAKSDVRDAEWARRYENNVELVKTCHRLAEGQQDLSVLVVKGLETVSHEVKTNQFCPMVRRSAGEVI